MCERHSCRSRRQPEQYATDLAQHDGRESDQIPLTTASKQYTVERRNLTCAEQGVLGDSGENMAAVLHTVYDLEAVDYRTW